MVENNVYLRKFLQKKVLLFSESYDDFNKTDSLFKSGTKCANAELFFDLRFLPVIFFSENDYFLLTKLKNRLVNLRVLTNSDFISVTGTYDIFEISICYTLYL